MNERLTLKSQIVWPRLMRAETAAAYLDEVSVSAFRRKVGKLYPLPIQIPGRGQTWLKTQLDQIIEELENRTKETDGADLL